MQRLVALSLIAGVLAYTGVGYFFRRLSYELTR
jgi:hypothetical protein